MLRMRPIHIVAALWICLFLPLSAQDTLRNLPKSDTLSNLKDSANPSSPKKSFNDIVIFTALDSMVLDFATKKVHLYKESKIETADTKLDAYYININLLNKELFAKGTIDSAGKYVTKPLLKDKGESFTADSMRYNSTTKKGKVFGLMLVQDQAYIQLGTVLKQADGSFAGINGKITTCDDPHPHFYLNTSKIKVIPNIKAFFSTANLVFQGIPTPIALPFGMAPLKKGQRDGIIFPSIGFNSANRSFYLQNFGYYIGLGPYSDIQLNSDAYLNGDFRLGVNTQYFRRYKFKGTLFMQYSRFSNGAEETSPEFAFTNDFSVRSEFRVDPKLIPGISLNGNINIVTKGFNQRNSRDINNLSNNQFTSSVTYGQQFLKRKVNLTVSARHSQNTQNGDFKMDLPAVNIGVTSLTPFASKIGSNEKWYQQIRVSYSGNMANNISTKDTIIFSDRYREAFETFRSGFNHTLPISTNIKLFKGILNISPSINYQEKWHFKGQYKSVDANNAIVIRDTNAFFRQYAYNVSTSLKTNIYGTFNQLKWGKIRAIRHTITPTIGLTYTPLIDAAKKGWTAQYTDTGGKVFTYGLFDKSPVGNLIQSESGVISFGLNNNLQGKKVTSTDSSNKSKTEKFNIIDQFQLSSGYNIFADSLKWSDVRMSFNTVIFKHIRINSGANYSPYYRNEQGNTLNRLNYNENGKILRFKNANININTSLSADKLTNKNKTKNPKKVLEEESTELADIRANGQSYYDFDIPWTINFGYMLNYNAETSVAANRVSNNNFTISGDINITENWKIGYQTGYDFRLKEMQGSQFTVARNLHCWQLEFSWVPTGFGKQWVFTLRPVSRLLQDLKLNKRVYSNPALM